MVDKKVSTANGARYLAINLDLHTDTNNFAPNAERLSIPPALSFTKDQTQEIIMIGMTATRK